MSKLIIKNDYETNDELVFCYPNGVGYSSLDY